MKQEDKIMDEAKCAEFERAIKECFRRNGTFMTADEFCKKLEALKYSLRDKYNTRHGYDNS